MTPDPGKRSALTLRDSIFLGFCAVIIVLGRALFRLQLHLPGHIMLFTAPALLVARGCVRNPLAATFAGSLAGVMSVVLGLIRGNPFVFANFVLPGVAIDLCAALRPRLFESHLGCAMAGGLAGATKLVATFLQDILVGMEWVVAVQHAALQTLPGVGFGVLGGLAVPTIIRRLRARGAIA